MHPSSGTARIPTLDGWRGLSILLVLLDHALLSAYGSNDPVRPLFGLGLHGVTVFFVLSGFLITSRLLAELDTSGTIRLTDFYRRRFFRLMPSAWLFLEFVAITAFIQHITHPGILPSLFFFRNYTTSHVLTGHFWTLSIEEQFYLFWPTVLLLLRRRAWTIAALGCATVCLWRTHDWTRLQSLHVTLSFPTQYRADALFLGCLLALFLPHLRPYLKPWLLIPLLAAFLACIATFHKLIPLSESAIIALLLGTTATHPRCWLSRLLETKALVQIGLISYSVYLWQQLILIHWNGPAFITVPALIAAALAIGYLNYTLVEKPMSRFGRSPLKPSTQPTNQTVPA